ncbi:MAG TPA: DMT family transporter [Patescibacteria group bacterium]|nr:DMT family transporter [Patescibacteria group bacterium]
MDQTSVLAILTMFSWGIEAIIAKLATNRIGSQSVLWNLIGYIPATIIYTLVLFRLKDLVVADRLGIALAILAGIIGSFGGVWFFILLTKKDASVVVPLTALYPALTALLAFFLLKESLTPIKILGIVLATVAVYCLSL